MGKSKAAEVREQASDTAGDVRDRAVEAAAALAEAASDVASKAKDATPDAVQDKAADLGETASRKRRPLALILAVAAAVTIALKVLRGKQR